MSGCRDVPALLPKPFPLAAGPSRDRGTHGSRARGKCPQTDWATDPHACSSRGILRRTWNPGPLCKLPLREARALEGICPGHERGHVCLESRVRGSVGAGTQGGLSLNTQHKQTSKPLPVCGQSPARHAPPLLLLRWTSGASGAGGVWDFFPNDSLGYAVSQAPSIHQCQHQPQQ